MFALSGLSLTLDTGGEVFGCIEVATAMSQERLTGRGTGVLKLNSAIVIKLTGSESPQTDPIAANDVGHDTRWSGGAA